MSTRTALAAALKTQLGAAFDVKPIENLPDLLRKPTVIVRHRDFQPAPNPGTMFATFIVTVASQFDLSDNWTKAEDALDEILPQVLEALDAQLGLTWTKATRVVVKDKYLGYDVEASIPTPRPY